MNTNEIVALIKHDQEHELKALKRVKELRNKAQNIIDTAGSVSSMSEKQTLNYKLFHEIADEIENLNNTKKALVKVYETKLQSYKSL